MALRLWKESEQLLGIPRGRACDAIFRFTAGFRKHAQDLAQIHGLIAARTRPGAQGSRHQIRCVRFDHQAVEWNVLCKLPQICPAPFVANPARNADIEPHVQVRAEGGGIACEAVRDTSRDPRHHWPQHFRELGMRIALMEEHGQPGGNSKIELCLECILLRSAR